MSNLRLNTNIKIFDNEPSKNIEHRRLQAYASLFTKLDANKNDKLDIDEINSFNETIKNAAGDDGVLDGNELKELAKKLSIKVNALRDGINMIMGDILSDNIYESMHHFLGNSRKDLDKTATLINQINQGNVAEVWQRYQEEHSLSRANAYLSVDIIEKFPENEANKLLDKLMSEMVKYANNNKVDISDLTKQYNTDTDLRVKNNIIIEIGARLILSNTAIADSYSALSDPKRITMSSKNIENLKKLAQNNDIEFTDDILGNGELGSSPSKALTKDSEKVLNVVNQLLSEEGYAQKIKACYKKYNHIFVCETPSKYKYSTWTENSLMNPVTLNGKEYNSRIEASTIGDGDTSAFVYYILYKIQNSKKDIEKMSENDIRNFILDLCNTRRYTH